MDFGFDETQQMLRSSARDFLNAECTEAYVRSMELEKDGYTPELWNKIAQQGWIGLVFPEEFGGIGMGFLELTILLEEMGRALLPSPYFPTVLLSGLTILEAGDGVQKEALIPKIISGQIISTLALTEMSASLNPADIKLNAEYNSGEFKLNGTKLFVPYANISDLLIVVARTGSSEQDLTMFVVPKSAKGISETHLKTIASDRQSEVTFSDVIVEEKNVLGVVNGAWPILEKILGIAAVGKSAEMLGSCDKVLEMTLDYVTHRTQFGRPIGTFQAIQHHCANMSIDLEGSRHLTYQAAWRLANDMESSIEVAMAKAWVSEASQRICATAHQCHGAIGFTKEHSLQLFSRRVKANEIVYGDSDYHFEKVALNIGL
ncbi:MAG: hypothetical protein CL735_02310 [Chloroflexi bacterium]|nr:hypothetical protein [Chloroflexota bacterium]|tara:strand:- start:91152 stop:92276 length:1125 start_codon:yes stop_codon:yes gene_type:complete